MKILITGVSGFVGKALVHSLVLNEKYSIVGLSRTDLDLPIDCIKIGDLSPSTNYMDLLSGVDVVIHLVARVHQMRESSKDPLSDFRFLNCATALNLAEQAACAGVRRFIFLSSIKVSGETSKPDEPFRIKDIIDLNCPLILKKDPYAVSKLECEQGLQSISNRTKMGVVIIRPPLVYGSGVKGNFISLLNLTKTRVPLPFKGIENKRSFVFVENLVSLIIKVVDHPNSDGEIFLVSDGMDISTSRLIETIYKYSGKKAKMFQIPKSVWKFFLFLIGKKCLYNRLFENLQVDISQTQAKLGWNPQFSVEDGIRKTINSYKKII